MAAELPTRYVNREAARRRYGDLADRYASFLVLGDPLADAAIEALEPLGRARSHALVRAALAAADPARVPDAPEALVALIRHVSDPPYWIDPERMDLGARTCQRLGKAQLFVLSAWSLMNGYHCSAAVKPLAFTGQLDRMAPRRLAETGRFVTETCQVGGMRRDAEGFAIAVRVRLMHAMVRRMLLRSPRWDSAAWGTPINQADMLGTIISFSLLLLAGARQLGFRFSRDESEAVLHLWRYSGWVSGVDPWLLSHLSDEERGTRFAEMVKLIQPGPDEDSRALAAALRTVTTQVARPGYEQRLAPLVERYHDGLTWAFNGDEMASALAIPNRRWRHAIVPTRAVVRSMELARRLLPGGSRAMAAFGNWSVRSDVARMLAGEEPSFQPVRQLRTA